MGGKLHGGRRVSLEEAYELFGEIESTLGQGLQLAGSARRKKATCGDLDILSYYPWVGEREMGQLFGGTGLYRGVQVDISRVPIGAEGTYLMHATGSAEENVRLRKKAKRLGLKLNQYGLWAGTENLASGMSEQDIYKTLGEPYVPPEER
jgi:DNA polymerase (family 10)